MALSPGTRLGPYEIVAPLGAGGMGEVYRARDTTLNRDVALKILPDAFAGDADRLARFAREAQTLAALNHPQIAAIYGVEEANDVRALVMELVEGEDLSQRIARGAIPLDEALPIAKQIVEALEAAHEQGIVHRDLKPANIKVRGDGTVKVLDFGLAKAMDPAGAMSSVSMSPTITTPAMTQAGMILGTAAYMSPEQARGKTVDKRSDIWAFGAVLYEMLAGVRPFDGEDTTEVIAAVVKTTPNWSALPVDVPRPIVTLIQRCLEKDRKTRVGDIAAARFLLADHATLEIAPAAAPQPVPQARSTASRALPWTLVGALATGLLVTLAMWAPWRTEKPLNRPLTRLDVDLGADVALPVPPTSNGSSVAISPDGTRIAYASGNPAKLLTRRLDQLKSTELEGTQGAVGPFFSPDGLWLGFFADGKVNKVSVEGGAVVPLGPVASVAGASWGEDGSILVSESFGSGLKRIPAGGGPPVPVAGLANGEIALALPQILPGGHAILFAADPGQGVDKTTIEVLTPADGRRKIVARGGNSPRYLPTSGRTGHLVYVNKAVLFAIPFDLDTLETRGTAVPVLDDVAYEPRYGTGQFDVSRAGTLVYRRGGSGASVLATLQWIEPSGKKAPLRSKPGDYRSPSLSPDGTRIALMVSEGGGNTDIWVYDPQRDAMTRLTFGGGMYRSPRWSPDGHYVVFDALGSGIFSARADGASQPQALTQAINHVPWSFTPDGKRLAYFVTSGGNSQIWTVPLEDQGGRLKAGTPEPFLKSTFNDTLPAFSPDGRWLAYQSNESGKPEVYVRAFPPPASGQGGKWQVSNSGGTFPRWSRSGRELLYQSGDQIMVASYAAKGDIFFVEKPGVWLAKLGAPVFFAGAWDLAPDGKRVAVVTPVESADAPVQEHEVVFLENFFDELRRRVPVR